MENYFITNLQVKQMFTIVDEMELLAYNFIRLIYGTNYVLKLIFVCLGNVEKHFHFKAVSKFLLSVCRRQMMEYNNFCLLLSIYE